MKHANFFEETAVGGGQVHRVEKQESKWIAKLNLLAQRLYVWSLVSRERRELPLLSDWMLKDIGISRADAHRESQRSFWDNQR